MTDLRAAMRRAVSDTAEPGAAELYHTLAEALLDSAAAEEEGPAQLERVKSHVYRLSIGSNGRARSVVLKRFDPWLARRNELVARRWLPAIGLGDRCPHLLATAADRRGEWVWHVYEDLGEGAVDAVHPDPARVRAVVDLIAELHTRAAGHALLPECRHFCGDLGAPFLAANVRDGIAVLEALAPRVGRRGEEARAAVAQADGRQPAPRHELVAAREPGIEALEHDRARPAVRSDAHAIDVGFHPLELGGPLVLDGGVEERFRERVVQLGRARLGRVADRALQGCT